jgi:hypothetical protein
MKNIGGEKSRDTVPLNVRKFAKKIYTVNFREVQHKSVIFHNWQDFLCEIRDYPKTDCWKLL